MYKLFIEKNTTTKELLRKVLLEYQINDEICYGEYGKPYLKNNEIYFNLSDSGIFTICVISDHQVGVDIEKITYNEKVIKYICTSKEASLINNADDFTKMWVKKESYVKYLGVGLKMDLRKVDTTKLKNIKILKHEDYYIAICLNDDLI